MFLEHSGTGGIIFISNGYLQVSWLISKLSMTTSPEEAQGYIANAAEKISKRNKEFRESGLNMAT